MATTIRAQAALHLFHRCLGFDFFVLRDLVPPWALLLRTNHRSIADGIRRLPISFFVGPLVRL